MELLWEIANNDKELTPSRIAAANHLLNRLQGLPVQPMLTSFGLNAEDDLTPDEERAQVEAYRETLLRRPKEGAAE